MACLDKSVKDPQLCLEVCRVAKDVQIFLEMMEVRADCTQATCVLVSETKPDKVSLGAHLIKAQRLGVRFEGFFVVFLTLLNQAEDVPTDMGREIESHALLDEIDALFAPSHMGE